MGTAATSSAQLTAGDFRLAVILSRYNEDIVEALLDGARAAWRAHGGDEAALRIERVPGAFELPLCARAFALGGTVDAVVALGCVIRGETAHFEFVAGECARGLQRVMLDTGVPVSFGVLTVQTREQALARAGAGPTNKGAEALETALAMASLLRRLR
ncbi:MAG TPA: 6,7-dimethyl-8-ribityllumazine synthase [Steroidobacteraceae bacterium]|jgi:6,7-dimethyl-8-ribityllumazine synthase|nr:6,7-dimethyl-8-ribityllumazine synthase [Steroidobacteraceae bacterium]